MSSFDFKCGALFTRRVVAILAALGATACFAQANDPVGMVDAPCAAWQPPPRPPQALIDLFLTPGAWDVAQLTKLLEGPEMKERQRLELLHSQTDWANLCHYDRANAELRRSGRVKGVFMGDSITEIWAESPTQIYGPDLLNRGISGQTSSQMVLRFTSDVVALRPKFVHIMAGTNDIAGNNGPTSAQRYKDNIAAMVALAKRNHIEVLLASIPPAASMHWRPTANTPARIRELNRWLQDFAKLEGLIYVDYHTALATTDGAFIPELTNDGVHANQSGYARMQSVLEAALLRMRP